MNSHASLTGITGIMPMSGHPFTALSAVLKVHPSARVAIFTAGYDIRYRARQPHS